VEDMKKISTDERPIEHSAGMRCTVSHELQEQTTNCTVSLLWWTCATAAQIVIESKADARKRGVKSADRAEAVAYAKVMSQADAWMEFYRQQAGQPAEGEDRMQCRKAVLAIAPIGAWLNLPPAAPVEKSMTAKGAEPWK